MKKKYLYIIILLFNVTSYTQEFSPSVSSLGTYNEIPVSHFTGVPDISIPLHTILVDNKNNLPLSISYHIRSVKPTLLPGIIGLGWSLQATGVIYRKVNWAKDEGLYNIFKSNRRSSRFHPKAPKLLLGPKSEGFYGSDKKSIKSNNWNSKSNLLEVIKTEQRLSSDEFSFNFFGKSGKFILDENGKWVTIESSEPLKIEFSNSFVPSIKEVVGSSLEYPFENPDDGVAKTFEEFIITDSKGTKYFFGKLNAIEYSLPIGTPMPAIKANSWFLNKIIYHGGKKVEFKYRRRHLDLSFYRSRVAVSYQGFKGNSLSSMDDSHYGNIIYPVYLDKIISDDQTVSFEYSFSKGMNYEPMKILKKTIGSNVWKMKLFFHYLIQYGAIPKGKNDLEGSPSITGSPLAIFNRIKLERVSVKDNFSGKITYKAKFNYTDTPKERLKLNSITIGLSNGANEKKYNMKYNEIKMYEYTEAGFDPWGYYNGTKEEDQNSRISSKYSEAETLKSITYPTKGTISFDFELNNYSKLVDIKNNLMTLDDKKGYSGGLRIKSISKIFGNGNTEVINYNYNNSGECSGVPQYSFYKDVKAMTYYPKGNFELNIPMKFGMQDNYSPLFIMSNNNLGVHTGYSKVTQSYQNNGKVDFYYSNYSNGILDDPEVGSYNKESCYLPYLSMNNKMRGKLIYKKVYDKANKLLKSDKFIYGKINDVKYRTINIYKHVIPNFLGTQNFIASAFANYSYGYKYLPTKQVSTFHSVKNNLITVENFKYTPLGLLREVERKNSRGKKIVKKIKYAHDVGDFKLIKKHRIGEPLEIKTYIDGFELSHQKIAYSDNHNPSGLYLPSKTLLSKGKKKLKDEIVYHNYDDKGNLLEISKKNGTKTHYIWGYHKKQLIAKIEGVTDAKFKKLKSLINKAISLSNLDKDLASEDALREGLNNIRNNQIMINTKVTSYTYDPLIGLTSITDPRGETTYYEYDDLNRLTFIKDSQKKILKNYQYNYKEN